MDSKILRLNKKRNPQRMPTPFIFTRRFLAGTELVSVIKKSGTGCGFDLRKLKSGGETELNNENCNKCQ